MSDQSTHQPVKVLLLGANGQLGAALQSANPLAATALHPLTRSQLDITSEAQLIRQFEQIKPNVVINASAYTAVDKAETDQDKAYQVNRDGPHLLAKMAKQAHCRVIHVSTDFVFDGKKSSPYLVDDKTNPINVYGKSKLQGELALIEQAESLTTIIRTSWLYSGTHPCFLASMLHLMANKPQLGVVADQVGSPTSVDSLAQVIWKAVGEPESNGIYHWSDAGVASWYDFAVAIQNQGLEAGLLKKKIEIVPLTTEQYPTPAARPSYSVMDKSESYKNFGVEAVHWQAELQKVISRRS